MIQNFSSLDKVSSFLCTGRNGHVFIFMYANLSSCLTSELLGAEEETAVNGHHTSERRAPVPVCFGVQVVHNYDI